MISRAYSGSCPGSAGCCGQAGVALGGNVSTINVSDQSHVHYGRRCARGVPFSLRTDPCPYGLPRHQTMASKSPRHAQQRVQPRQRIVTDTPIGTTGNKRPSEYQLPARSPSAHGRAVDTLDRPASRVADEACHDCGDHRTIGAIGAVGAHGHPA
jgi:hypothetical protein